MFVIAAAAAAAVETVAAATIAAAAVVAPVGTATEGTEKADSNSGDVAEAYLAAVVVVGAEASVPKVTFVLRHTENRRIAYSAPDS